MERYLCVICNGEIKEVDIHSQDELICDECLSVLGSSMGGFEEPEL